MDVWLVRKRPWAAPISPPRGSTQAAQRDGGGQKGNAGANEEGVRESCGEQIGNGVGVIELVAGGMAECERVLARRFCTVALPALVVGRFEKL